MKHDWLLTIAIIVHPDDLTNKNCKNATQLNSPVNCSSGYIRKAKDLKSCSVKLVVLTITSCSHSSLALDLPVP